MQCVPSICIPVGTPDPPSDLGYNDRVVIEREVDLQWTRPSYTGGVSVTRYEISADRLSEEVVAEGEKVSYSGNSSLVYGEVAVTAINYCGQRSQPANISIHAAGDFTATVAYMVLVRVVLTMRTPLQ